MLSSFPMSGATTPPDKLQQLRARMESAATPAERIEATMELAEETWVRDPVTVRPLLEQVVTEADAAGRVSDKGRAMSMLGEMQRRAGDLDGAARYAEMLFKLADATGDHRVRAYGLNLCGCIYGDRGESKSALECFEGLLKVAKQIGSAPGETMALNQLACVHAARGDLDFALDRYRECLTANA